RTPPCPRPPFDERSQSCSNACLTPSFTGGRRPPSIRGRRSARIPLCLPRWPGTSFPALNSPALRWPYMKPHILVVEDEPGIAEPLAITLARDGFTTEIAGTVADAKERFHTRSPELVLLDIMLPDGDGRDLCRDLRKESDVPIIM